MSSNIKRTFSYFKNNCFYIQIETNWQILETLQILKIEQHVIAIKFLPTQLIGNLKYL